ncbi:exosome complex component CSL4-like [Panonychus citri]|uniref:exosome complex component CSL4-like n=1 Tax=Panonychus citri TaxID=50023 RepID=UPI00230712B8|nr:exosome complex component CSL4-like [Panonychus citri]
MSGFPFEKRKQFFSKMFCVPGDRLSVADEKNLGGRGTFIKGSYIYAALAGKVNVNQNEEMNIVEVVSCGGITRKVPLTGDIVTCQIDKVTSTQCKCLIQCIADVMLKRPFKAIIRKEDVRETDKDNVDLYSCFRPGDLIICKIIGLSDFGYLLTTASNEFGVVTASENGILMVPVSWTEMICPETKVKEPRKVAQLTKSTKEKSKAPIVKLD